ILAAIVLSSFGTSSVQGFATMLVVSILASFLTAVYVTRLLLNLWVQSGYLKNRKSWFGVKADQIQDINSKEEKEPTIFNRTVDIVKQRKKSFTFSIVLLIIVAISLGIFKLNPGIDFTSGSRVDILSDDSLTTEEVESDFDSLNLDTKAIVLNGDNNETAVTRFDSVLSEDKITEVKNY